MLLYLKCFLTSFPAPGRGAASPFWGGPLSHACPAATLGQPSPMLLLATFPIPALFSVPASRLLYSLLRRF